MKDDLKYWIKQGEHFSYETINVDYLRSRMTLLEWLKKYKRTRAMIRWDDESYSGDAPPGHPKWFLYQPRTYTGVVDVTVIPDPENFAYGETRYSKEDKYIPDGEKGFENNQYYVVYPSDYKKLWINPLPWEHRRMQMWEENLYAFYGSRYVRPDGETFFYPLQDFDRKVRGPYYDPKWRQEFIDPLVKKYEMEKAAEEYDYQQNFGQYATPESNLAVITIRKWFKDYQPNLHLLEHARSQGGPYSWYKRYTSEEAMLADPIFRIAHKVDQWEKS